MNVRKKPVVFGCYGKSGTGKTSLIVKLIKRLRNEGVAVASMKVTDKSIGIDQEGKDTWMHSEAGAQLVIFSSLDETDFIVKHSLELDAIVETIQQLGEYDVILVEGASDPSIPKIKIGDIETRENTLCSYSDNVDEIMEMIHMEMKNNSAPPDIRILVNGKPVSISEFPAHIIKNTIIGMLSSLKGINEIETVDISFKN